MWFEVTGLGVLESIGFSAWVLGSRAWVSVWRSLVSVRVVLSPSVASNQKSKEKDFRWTLMNSFESICLCMCVSIDN